MDSVNNSHDESVFIISQFPEENRLRLSSRGIYENCEPPRKLKVPFGGEFEIRGIAIPWPPTLPLRKIFLRNNKFRTGIRVTKAVLLKLQRFLHSEEKDNYRAFPFYNVYPIEDEYCITINEDSLKNKFIGIWRYDNEERKPDFERGLNIPIENIDSLKMAISKYREETNLIRKFKFKYDDIGD